MSDQTTPTDLAMMHEALELATQASAIGEVPVGAVVWELETGKVLGRGFNRRETDADPSAHAEFIAILNACKGLGDWRLNHCGLAVTLEPCPMCAGAIVQARIPTVIYGAADPKAGAVDSLYQMLRDERLNHRPVTLSGVLADRCGAILTEFFQRQRKLGKK